MRQGCEGFTQFALKCRGRVDLAEVPTRQEIGSFIAKLQRYVARDAVGHVELTLLGAEGSDRRLALTTLRYYLRE